MTTLPDSQPVIGERIRLDPLTAADVDELAAVLLAAQVSDPLPKWFPPPADLAAARGVATAMMASATAPDGRGGGRLTYVLRLVGDSALGLDGRLVGTTSLSEIDVVAEKAHLGATLYHPDCWGTVVNPEAKLLVLGRCFEAWGFGRIKIQTDSRNERSQRAIAKLGATREGVLRRDSRRGDGTFRDVVVFSILATEWPGVRDRLRRRLGSPA